MLKSNGRRANHFSLTAGSQEPWCGDAGCQQGEHSKPACGGSLRGSGTALHGSVHGHPGGRGAELVAGAGGASQGSASERRYRALSLRPSPLLLPFFGTPSPEGPFSLVVFGATHTAQTTPLASCHVVTTQRGLVESAMLQICGQICGTNPNSRSEHQIL